MKNTYRIVPEWQHLAAGDGVRFHPRFPRVPALEPNRTLIPGSLLDASTGCLVQTTGTGWDAWLATSWAFVLRRQGEGQTRLIAGLHNRWPDGLRAWLVNRLFGELAHFFTRWQMLRTVRGLAGAAARAREMASAEAVATLAR